MSEERDMRRSKNFGLVDMPTNSHDATSNFYVDRSRLRVTERMDWSAPGPGRVKIVETASILDNARQAAMQMGIRSSFQNHVDCDPNSWQAGEGRRGSLQRNRGDK